MTRMSILLAFLSSARAISVFLPEQLDLASYFFLQVPHLRGLKGDDTFQILFQARMRFVEKPDCPVA